MPARFPRHTPEPSDSLRGRGEGDIGCGRKLELMEKLDFMKLFGIFCVRFVYQDQLLKKSRNEK
jgi:hypothetical protein